MIFTLCSVQTSSCTLFPFGNSSGGAASVEEEPNDGLSVVRLPLVRGISTRFPKIDWNFEKVKEIYTHLCLISIT